MWVNGWFHKWVECHTWNKWWILLFFVQPVIKKMQRVGNLFAPTSARSACGRELVKLLGAELHGRHPQRPRRRRLGAAVCAARGGARGGVCCLPLSGPRNI